MVPGTPNARSAVMTRSHWLSLAVVMLVSLGGRSADAQAPAKQSAAPAASKTIILVHGAFADSSAWDRVVPILQAKGYNVIALHQPLTSLADDVAAAKRTIAAQPGDVILVGHSYGGMIITEAGNDPKVTGLVYVAAFAPDANQSINDMGKGQPAPEWTGTMQVDAGGYGSLPLESVQKFFAPGLPAKDARLITAKQGPVPTKTFDAKVTTPAWKTKRSWYVRADQDRMIAPEAQAQMAKRINATTTTVRSNHLPMVMKPQDVAKVILAAASAPPEVATK